MITITRIAENYDKICFFNLKLFAQALHQIIYIFASVKIIAAILSIYIFALNLVPCQDSNSSNEEVKVEISQATDDNHQHQDGDFCSPFCSCQCCQISFTNYNVLDYAVFSPVTTTEEIHFSYRLEKDYHPTILQPPQV